MRSLATWLVVGLLLGAGGCGRPRNCPGPNQCKTGCNAEGQCLCTTQAHCALLQSYCDGTVCQAAPDGGGPGANPTGGGTGSDAGP